MKKMIRLKGLCLKVSETLNTKKIEKKKKAKKKSKKTAFALLVFTFEHFCLKF